MVELADVGLFRRKVFCRCWGLGVAEQFPSHHDFHAFSRCSEECHHRLRHPAHLVSDLYGLFVGVQPVLLDHHQSVIAQLATLAAIVVELAGEADPLQLDAALQIGFCPSVLLPFYGDQVIQLAQMAHTFLAPTLLDHPSHLVQRLTVHHLVVILVSDNRYFHRYSVFDCY